MPEVLNDEPQSENPQPERERLADLEIHPPKCWVGRPNHSLRFPMPMHFEFPYQKARQSFIDP